MDEEKLKNKYMWYIDDSSDVPEHGSYEDIELTEEDIAIGDAIFKDVLD